MFNPSINVALNNEQYSLVPAYLGLATCGVIHYSQSKYVGVGVVPAKIVI